MRIYWVHSVHFSECIYVLKKMSRSW